MADTFPRSSGRASFAHERRADLPGHDGNVDHSAGTVHAAFHRALTAAAPRQTDTSEDGDTEGPGNRRHPSAFALPDPHPSFAYPATGPDRDLLMEKSAFVEMRQATSDRPQAMRRLHMRSH